MATANLTTHEDFQIDQRTVTLPRHVFAALTDQIEQYQDYAETLRHELGRGFWPSSPFSPEVTIAILKSALNDPWCQGAAPAPKTKAPKAAKVEPVVDTATLSDSELFAYYKKISLREDVRFFLRATLPATVRLDAEALLAELETRKSTTADKKRYHVLTDLWRQSIPSTFKAQRIARKLAQAQLRKAA